MKIRKGFVSNSSSSSFICDVCGSDYSGMDATLEDADMFECENGHTFCTNHLVGDTIGRIDDPYGISENRCPICKLVDITDNVIVEYYVRSSNKSREDIENEIKSKFKTLNELYKFNEKNEDSV